MRGCHWPIEAVQNPNGRCNYPVGACSVRGVESKELSRFDPANRPGKLESNKAANNNAVSSPILSLTRLAMEQLFGVGLALLVRNIVDSSF